ncbi:MAG TPA: hypothetical protein VFI31_27200 [Pirellulales bacterium]|nr:hypothetical protein [Pirellulales bacterium]
MNAETGKPANAITDQQGNFVLQTYLGGQNQAKGALPGDYTVVIRKDNSPPPTDESYVPDPDEERKKSEANLAGAAPVEKPKLLTPLKYSEATTSPLKLTVKAGLEPQKYELTDD